MRTRLGFCFGARVTRAERKSRHGRQKSRTARTGHGPFGMRLSPDGKRGYVAVYLASAIEVMNTDPASSAFGTILTTIANAGYEPENKE